MTRSAPGGAAYVVNEWIDGETLAERLARGPLPERDVRTVLRRLAEGVAEAHRVGLAVGGLTTDNVVLRPNGLVGLRAVPAATGTIDGDIAALGALLEVCLTGLATGEEQEPRPLTGPSDLLALVRRARSDRARSGALQRRGHGRPARRAPPHRRRGAATAARSAPPRSRQRLAPSDARPQRRRGRDRRHPGPAAGDRRPDGAVPPVRRWTPQTMPPVPPVRPVRNGAPLPPAALGGDTIDAGTVAPRAGAYAGAVPPARRPARQERPDRPRRRRFGVAAYDDVYGGYEPRLRRVQPTGDTDADRHRETAPRRAPAAGHRPAAARAGSSSSALAWWVGTTLLVGDRLRRRRRRLDALVGGASSSSSAAEDEPAAAGRAVADRRPPTSSTPQGDGEPENNGDVPLAFDGDPATAWSTLNYRGSPAFGNLKPGVGVLYDLGSAQQLAGVTRHRDHARRHRRDPHRATSADGDAGQLHAAAGRHRSRARTEFTFDEPATARYVLVWVTGLVRGRRRLLRRHRRGRGPRRGLSGSPPSGAPAGPRAARGMPPLRSSLCRP